MRHALRAPSSLALLLAAGVAGGLAGCSQVGNPVEVITEGRPAPDEFMVLPRKPLVIPENLDTATALPRPEPGKATPLEPDPQVEAVTALTGRTAAPASGGPGSASTGERALLDAASARAADPEIREQLAADRRRAEEEEASGPYVPPTVAELLGGGSDEEEIDPELVLDPVTEAQRLQRSGVAAPSDPDARAPEPEAEEVEQSAEDRLEPDYRANTPYRGQRLSSPDAAPAFE